MKDKDKARCPVDTFGIYGLFKLQMWSLHYNYCDRCEGRSEL